MKYKSLNIKYFFIIFYLINFINLGYAQEINLTEEEKKWIVEHPTIKVASGSNAPPIEFNRQGIPVGYSVDFINLVTKKVGLNIEFVDSKNFNDYLHKIKNHEIDVVHSISQTPERDEYLKFTTPYMNIPFVYFSRKGSAPINSIKDLEGRRIGTIRGWITTETYKRDYPHLILVEQSTTKGALNALSAGFIDVFVIQLPVGTYSISKNFISGLEVIGGTFFPQSIIGDNLTIASRSDWPILNKILQKGSDAVSEHEMLQISNKWLVEYNVKDDIGLTQEELDWLSENNTIIVTADPEAAPIEFIDQNGKISGMSGAYLDLLSAKLNIEFQWLRNDDIASGVERLKNGEAHIMSAATPSPERLTYLNFSENYLSISTVIFARVDSIAFGSLDALSGYKAALVKGFAVTEHVKRNYPEIDVIELSSISAALNLVNSGGADAFVGSIPAAASVIASEGLVQLLVVGESDYRAFVSIASLKGMPLLGSSIQKAMKSITDIEHAEISKKWMALKIDRVENYDLLIKSAFAALIIISIILIWNASLRREIKRRIIAENKMRKAQIDSEHSNKAKSAFLANMSHEIRTPLNAIIGFSEVMTSGIFGKIDNEKYVEYLNDINHSGKHLSTVINDILDLSKIEAGKWPLNETEFNIKECLTLATKMFNELRKEKNVSLSLKSHIDENELCIRADEHCIKRAAINLLSNAIKFSKPGGNVECIIKEDDDDNIIIEVIDNGIGIPEDRLKHVMDPFGQILYDQSFCEAGTGLGLSIVNNLMKLHNAQFKLSSEEGVGTTASMIIPLDRRTQLQLSKHVK